ncbi:hypothetical protein H0H92_008517 [Tricholoma furcatifolium]|nr:hypothetical protein H0H92_008517 [Tricholoma furcatifolium]
MEEIHPQRSIQEGEYGSTHSVGSERASLRGRGAAPAGSRFSEDPARTTAAGVVPPAGDASTGAAAAWGDQDPASAPPPAASKPPLYKRRWFIISQLIIWPLGIALLFIILFPVVRAIVQLVIKRTQLDIESAIISQAQNSTFQLTLQGNVTHTGIIPAKIEFLEPVNVSWFEDEFTETPIGTMTFSPLSAKHKRAPINTTSTFVITDEDAFGRFSAQLITSSNFTWHLKSSNLRVQALKFPVDKGLTFDKNLTMNGIFNGNVVLKDLQLPSDNPAGGINFEAVTQLNNTSPFSLDLGTVVFALSYKNASLGTGAGTNTVIGPGLNDITLVGVMEPQTNPENLALVSELFTNYLNGVSSPVIATGVSTLQNDNTSISWLSQGLQALSLNVPFKSATEINPIQSITIGDLALQFDESNPWTPGAESNSVQASLKLPFGFSMAIEQIQNNFTIVNVNGSNVAGLSTPVGASQSSISVLSPTDTEGTINITISDTNLTCPDPQHPAFSQFNADLTSLSSAQFRLVGSSRAVANTSLGQITLDAIQVNVSSTLNGLQGLQGLTTIESVDVQGGTQDYINLGIEALQLLRDGVALGTALLPNLTLARGNNTFQSTSNFEANNSPQGLQTLNDFVGKQDVELQIAGFSGSTDVASLVQAFETLNISVILPGLKTNLVESASLTMLSTTGVTNNISHVTVSLVNPFSAALDITKISSTVTSFGIPLGTINADVNFTSAPNSTTESPTLNLDMNFDPAALFTVTRALAVEAGLDVAPLDAIVQLGGIQYLTITGDAPTSSRRANIFDGFNLPDFVNTAFKKLQSDVNLTVDVTIGREYQTTLQYTQTAVPVATDSTLDLILPVLAAPIVQKIVGGSSLGISTVLITDPQETSFGTQLQGNITNAGPFDAVISFPSGLTINWDGQPLGNVKMQDVTVTGDVGGSIDATTTFTVADVDHLTDFTKTMLTEESFEWDISGQNLSVSALGISTPGIELTSRSVTLKGFNGLQGGVVIETFDLPSDDPAGGIHLTLEATTTNPSQVGISLSSIGFDTYVGDILVAPVLSSGAVTLAPESTSNLSLVGRLVPQDSSEGLSTVSNIFNNFIQGKDSDVVVKGASAGPSDVTWLNEGIQALSVATVLPNQGVQNIIKSISLNELQLFFTDNTAYDPLTSSQSTDAAFTLPFGFPIDITSLEQNITLGFQGTSFAELVIPEAPSTTDVQNRIIHLTFENIPFAVFSDQHSTFDQFVAATTIGQTQTLQLSGSASANAQTAVGLLTLEGINFSVESSIDGLQGLDAKPVTIGTVDVNHGFSDYLLIIVDATMFNPRGQTVGLAELVRETFKRVSRFSTPNGRAIWSLSQEAKIIQSVYLLRDVQYSPQGGAVSAGQILLQDFVEGIDVDTTIAGSTGSTPIPSLQSALSQIRLSPVTLPALKETLITSASLSFPTNVVQTGLASTSFTLADPFTASINLLTVDATATYQGILLGKIDNVDLSSNPFHVAGHSSATSPTLQMEFNIEPLSIIELLSVASQQNGVDLGPLTELLQFVVDNPDFKPPVVTSVDTSAPVCVRCVDRTVDLDTYLVLNIGSGQQFDVEGAILKTLSGLKVDLAVNSALKLDDFATDLSFNQSGVPATTDDTALYLIGAVAGPVTQHLVDGSILQFTAANITNISNDGFDLALAGSLTNVGPLDAYIEFVDPLTVTWQGQDIATIALPPVCAAANTGVPDYTTTATLKITDSDAFTNFATFLLHNPSFNWTVSTSTLRLTALNTVFDNVELSKVLTFTAFNGLPGVTISNFQLPSDNSAGGITINTDAMIPSPSQLGMDLGSITFQAFFQDVLVGPLAADNVFLAPDATTTLQLSGRMIPQTGSDLDTIGVLFSNFLAGNNQTLVTKGNSVQPSGSDGPVTWLSTAFQTLALEVTLPGQKFDIIQSIALNDLEITMDTQDQAFSPPTSSQSTLAQYKNPFGFSLQVIESGQILNLNSNGVDIAQLVIPKVAVDGGVSTGNIADLVISFQNIPLTSLNDAAFEQMFAGVTLEDEVDLTLEGTANITAKTSIGDVAISGVPFNVASSLTGINSFNHTAVLSNYTVTGSGGDGGDEYIITALTTTLQNPSNVTLNTVDISLPVIYQGTMIGRAVIDPFQLVPGTNPSATEFRYQPDNANDTTAQAFLASFLQTGDTLDLTIQGDSQSSPFTSLSVGLAQLQLSTSLIGLDQPTFITSIAVSITLDSLVDNLVIINFNLTNPLDADLVIEFVQSDSGVNGETYAFFGQAFDSFIVPPGQTVNSGDIPNVLLTQGVAASLSLIAIGELDVSARTTVRVGQGGYQVPWLLLQQTGVPATYSLDLTESAMQSIQSGSSSSASGAATETSDKASATSSSSQSTSAPAAPTSSSSATSAAADTSAASSTTSAPASQSSA